MDQTKLDNIFSLYTEHYKDKYLKDKRSFILSIKSINEPTNNYRKFNYELKKFFIFSELILEAIVNSFLIKEPLINNINIYYKNHPTRITFYVELRYVKNSYINEIHCTVLFNYLHHKINIEIYKNKTNSSNKEIVIS